jgi:hypothetical protein
VDSLSPNHYKSKLNKELYFDPSKYDENKKIKYEQDNLSKPKLIKKFNPNEKI